MRQNRRDRRALALIETQLTQDRDLVKVFDDSSLLAPRRGDSVWDWCGSQVFTPTSQARALVAAAGLQLLVVVGCVVATACHSVALVACVLATYPFSLTPLHRWSRRCETNGPSGGDAGSDG